MVLGSGVEYKLRFSSNNKNSSFSFSNSYTSIVSDSSNCLECGEKMRKSIFLFLILALFCGCLSHNSQEIQSIYHNKLSINNFWVYYGSNHVEELSKYDLVIIEPYNYNKEEIKRLKELNPKIKVIAYLSIGEVDKERDYFEDCKSIIIGENPNWDSYYVNISSPIWRNIIFNEIDKFIDMGFDGIFLDTVDSAIYTNQKDDVVELIKDIRKRYPTIIIIQNRGLEVVDKTAPYIDAVLFEDFSTYYDFKEKKAKFWSGNDLKWTDIQAERLKKLNIIVLTLDYVNDEEMAKKCIERAEEYGFIPMVTKDIYLNSIK